MPSATEPMRIPAWKRLGLKLKSAQEDTSTAPPTSIDSKRKRLDVKEKNLSKKPKTTPEPHGRVAAAQVTPKITRKKSVTFTPETKVEDGDSIKQLFNAWKAEQEYQDNLSAPVFQTPKYSEVEENIDPLLDEKERRVKRVKTLKQGKHEANELTAAANPAKPKERKDKRKKETSQSDVKQTENNPRPAKKPKSKKKGKPSHAKPSENPTPAEKPFLAYLKQYTNSRSTWKFNKNHQSHLLRHIFDLETIPSSYAYYVYEYIKGLQGTGVRTRLRDAALAEKVRDQEADMECDAQRKREYDEAMREYVATMMVAEVGPDVNYEEGQLLGLSDVAMQAKVAKRKRAERVLAELSSGEEDTTVFVKGDKEEVSTGDDGNQKRLRMSDGTVQKVVRKRKQRTAVMDDDGMSSEEDSSDSEASSSGESTSLRDDTEDTSSSSASSSSSGSEESDSEEGSEESSSEESESE